MSKFYYTLAPAYAVFIIFSVMMIVFSESIKASDELQSGSQFKVIRQVYLTAAYKSLNNRQVNRKAARAYLESKKFAKTSRVAFQSEVPVGTVMTIIGKAPKIWYLPWGANSYFVKLNPDLSRGLEVVLKLNIGLEGDLYGLNPELFVRILGDVEL